MTDKKKEVNDHETPVKKAEKFSETLQYLGIIGAIVMGLRQPPKAGESVVGDKQVPSWILSAFPSLTDEDEVEYNLILSSLADNIKIALKVFEFQLKCEGIYDETKLRVILVKIRREFLEKAKSPTPENKSANITFGKLEMKDPVTDFATLLEAEKIAGRTPEEIFENQKLISDNLKLLRKRSLLKELSEIRMVTLLSIISVVLAILATLKIILS